MATKKGPADFRSAKSGEFVTKKYAEKNPSTTVKEHNKTATKTQTPKKKK